MKKKNKIRLYVENELSTNVSITLNEAQTHYLCNVLRQEMGDTLNCFDNRNGEFVCEITAIHKKNCELAVLEKVREFHQCPDLWLLFAPVKKDKTDFIIEKATELGVRRIIPAITARTVAEKVRHERFCAQAVEAAEQCRRVDLPEISPAQTLTALLKDWDKSRILYYMDESGNGESALKAFNPQQQSSAVLVGPEGGFAEQEFKLLRSLPFTRSVSLGPRILRAETAVVAALSLWQAVCGDWSKEN